MTVILNYVIDALSPFNSDSLKKTNKKISPYHMDSLPCLKEGSISFFYALLAHGVAAP